MVNTRAERQPFFTFFPVGAKEVLCYALRTLATGSEPALLDCENYWRMNKLGGSRGMLSQEFFFKIRHSEITSEAMPKCY